MFPVGLTFLFLFFLVFFLFWISKAWRWASTKAWRPVSTRLAGLFILSHVQSEFQNESQIYWLAIRAVTQISSTLYSIQAVNYKGLFHWIFFLLPQTHTASEDICCWNKVVSQNFPNNVSSPFAICSTQYCPKQKQGLHIISIFMPYIESPSIYQFYVTSIC